MPIDSDRIDSVAPDSIFRENDRGFDECSLDSSKCAVVHFLLSLSYSSS